MDDCIASERSLYVVDDARTLTELMDTRLAAAGYAVTCEDDPSAAVDAIAAMAADGDGPDLALVDLSFPHHKLNGLDVLMAFARSGLTTRLVVYTQGDRWAGDLLALAWEAFGPATCVSKLSSFDVLVSTLDRVAVDGSAPNDPSLAVYLPAERSPWRTLEGYTRLVPHGGHAKMWSALFDAPEPPTYRELGDATGLAVNTLRNYREDLVGELELHGERSWTLQEIHHFACTRRPLLQPAVDDKLVGRLNRPPTGPRSAPTRSIH